MNIQRKKSTINDKTQLECGQSVGENAEQVSGGCPQLEHVTSHAVLPEAYWENKLTNWIAPSNYSNKYQFLSNHSGISGVIRRL